MELEKPLDLSRWLTERKVRSRIHRVGLELEGAWDKLPPRTRLTRDGSLDPFARRLQENGLVVHVGELPSPPLCLEKGEETVYWADWLTRHYPQRVSPECGLHIHMSFLHALTYQRLMVPSYPSTVVAYMKAWATKEGLAADHPLWPRLEGKSRYCQHKFFADQQASSPSKDYDQQREGHRYTVINYCYTRNHTVECRLLPMFEGAEQAQRALQEIITITNAFLVATAAREKKIISRVDIKGVSKGKRAPNHVVRDDPERYREVRIARA